MPRRRRAPGVCKQGSSEAKAKFNTTRMRAGNRKCKRCKIVFYRERGTGDTICPTCKEHCSRCNRFLTEENKIKNHVHHYLCKPCSNETKRNAPGYHTFDRRDYHLNKKYGITVNEYEAILKGQNGVCWVCQKPPKEGGKRLHVDHLHSKGENKRNPREKRGRIRGLLCWYCNVSIGKFNDQPTLLRRAADYLEQWPAQKYLKEKQNG